MTTGITAKGVTATPGIPEGGTTDQALTKASNTDYDVAWVTVAAAAHTHTLADITDDGALAALNTVGTAQIDNSAVTLAKMADLATDRLIGRDTAGTGVPEALTVGGGIEFSGAGGVQTSAFTGDVTKSAGGTALTIANDAVTYAKMQNVSVTDRLLGRDTASAGDVEELTVGGGIEFTGSGGIQRSALTGDVTASAGSGSTTIANDAVTYAKMQNVSATDKVLGRSTAGSGDVEEIACTAAGRALIDDADASAQRTTLGLGTAATQSTGTSGATVPLLNTSCTWSGDPQTLSNTGAGATLIFSRPEVHGDVAPVGIFSARGKNSSGTTTTFSQVVTYCIQDNAASEQGQVFFQTINAGTTQNSFSVGPGLVAGGPTGGDKGYGTINATAVYDDNTLLTCYVFDAAIDGAINTKKWDDKVPDVDYVDLVTNQRVFQERTHEPLRKFSARLGGPEDPLDIEKYIAHWRTKRHLTSMPNEASFDPQKGLPTGSWIQRLVETVEIQAVHIAQLHERLKTLEALPQNKRP